eukprot:CAMPEP_0115450172 /NCGR_PEP_ID=MMETSP0271-20121206/41397_1 /TAXON_ID=71861 /ORGANISM="Scrippsiella trochoidea, Strain CCMP3099" /LENGTH=79 /DNA_ID=CAMNT_0002876371 /DNA_START=92 /DNA_END=328 /DNA_ORIENTATION=+
MFKRSIATCSSPMSSGELTGRATGASADLDRQIARCVKLLESSKTKKVFLTEIRRFSMRNASSSGGAARKVPIESTCSN